MMPDAGHKPAGRDAAPDYAAMYREYWSRDDRWNTHSFRDADAVAEQILGACGAGPILDVGCGMGLLVRTLLRRGVDARGVDIAEAPVEEANRLAPGRFGVGSILDLPFESGAVPTVVCTDLLEHIGEDDVARALQELRRVAGRSCFIRLSTAPDRDDRWHLTVRDRDWWLARLFEAGFRRHPLAQTVVPYDAIAGEGWQITLVVEKPASAEPCPPAPAGAGALARDATCETGDEAERAIAEVVLASRYVADGDRVLDAGVAAGWSAAMLSALTGASEVVGVTRDGIAGWAERRFGGAGARFADASEFRLEDRRYGVIVALGRFGDERELRAELGSLHWALEPGGRLVVDVPGAVEAERLDLEDLGLLLDAQFAAGPPDGPDAEESPFLQRIAEGEAIGACERSVLVLMRDPAGATAEGYVERVFPEHLDTPGFHVANYGRDLDNPWLLRAMISVGMRGANPRLNALIAAGTLEAARPGSSDEGAGLCVLAYRLLDAHTVDPDRARELIQRIERYHDQADATPYAWRWRISNQYASGLLRLALGDLEDARRAFIDCASLDPTPYSPLLASKTVDAWYWAGLIDAAAGRVESARACWIEGLRALEGAIKSDWLNVWGSPEAPLSFAMADLAILVDLGSRCAWAINALENWEARPGPAWALAHRQTLADMRRRVDRVEQSREWMDGQRAWLRSAVESRDEAIARLRSRLDELDGTRRRLEDNRRHLIETNQQLRAQIAELRELSATRAGAQQGRIEELREAIRRLTEAREFLRSQVEARDARLERASQADRARRQNQDWHEGRLRAERARAADAEAHLRQRIENAEAQLRAAREGAEFWKQRADEASRANEQRLRDANEELAKLRQQLRRARGRSDAGPEGSDSTEAMGDADKATIAPEEASGGAARVKDQAERPPNRRQGRPDQAAETDS